MNFVDRVVRHIARHIARTTAEDRSESQAKVFDTWGKPSGYHLTGRVPR